MGRTPRRLGSSVAVVGLVAIAASLLAAGCSNGADDEETLGSSGEALVAKCGAKSTGPVQGVDVSVYQGDYNFAAAHVQFAYTRISDGLTHVDSTFATNWSHMKSAGILRGAYQYFRPGQDETAQAKLVIDKVGKLGPGDLPVELDIETTDGVSTATMIAKAKHWLQLVEAGTGRKPMVYTYSSFFAGNVGLGGYSLWIADYGASCPLMPAGWSNWAFWQYSDGGGSLDHDVFNGTLADLKVLAGEGAPPADAGAPPPPADAGEPAAPPPPPPAVDAGGGADFGADLQSGQGGGCAVGARRDRDAGPGGAALVVLLAGVLSFARSRRRRSST